MITLCIAGMDDGVCVNTRYEIQTHIRVPVFPKRRMLRAPEGPVTIEPEATYKTYYLQKICFPFWYIDWVYYLYTDKEKLDDAVDLYDLPLTSTYVERVFHQAAYLRDKREWRSVTLADKINLLLERYNEVSFGYDDCGCFWHFHYGSRGSGAMIDGIGQTFASEPVDFEEAVDEFLAHLGIQQ